MSGISTSHGLDAEPVRVLLVSEDPADARLVEETLAGLPDVRVRVECVRQLPEACGPPAGSNIDLIILDVQRPGKTGDDLIDQAHAAAPHALLLLISDAPEEAVESGPGQAPARENVVRVRVDRSALGRALQRAIERRRDRAACSEKQEITGSLVDQIPDQVYVKDTASRFVSVNPETARFLGASSPEEIVGKCDSDFFPRELAAQFLAEEKALMQCEQPCVNRAAAVTDAAGRRRWVLTTKVPLRDAGGRITGLLGINRDVTDLREAHEALRNLNVELEQRVAERTLKLQAANELLREEIDRRKRTEEELLEAVTRLEAQDRAKSVFVANVSHELKTPLASMNYGVSNMLRGMAGLLPERALEYLRMLQEDCHRMLHTVADILDLSRCESRTMRLNKTALRIDRLVKRAVAAVSAQAGEKHIAIRLAMDEGPRFVDCDALKMERVIINVVDNAIKYTPKGGNIDVTVRDAADADSVVTVAVADNGIGIAPEYLGKVTERFFRAGEQVDGTGLGLAIAKEIVTFHGGRMDITSPPPQWEKGTLVTLRLPVTEAPTLLLADDDADARCLLERQLRHNGYSIIICENGRLALELTRREKPDLCLLDIYMPEMDGTEVILLLKADESLRRIPVLVVTGGILDREKQAILQGFGIAPLAKPWSEEELVDRIETALIGVALSGGGLAPESGDSMAVTEGQG